jgi:hypothetical protein
VKIREVLPLLRGWYYEPKDIDEAFTIKAGQAKSLFREADKIGWLLGCTIALDNKDAHMEIEYDNQVLDFTPYDLYTLGIVYPNPSGFWCTRYDPELKLYGMMWTAEDLLGFNKTIELRVRAPEDADVTVYLYAHLLAIVLNKDEFIEDLRKLQGMSGGKIL